MDDRLTRLAELASAFHGVVSLEQIRGEGIPRSTANRWVSTGRLVRLGPRSFTLPGTPPTWHRELAARSCDLGPHAAVAGRSAARLHRLDGFDDVATAEFLLPVEHRRCRAGPGVHVTTRPVPATDMTRIDGLPCLRPERLILDARLFCFTRSELERAIDDAVRRRLVSVERLRRRSADHPFRLLAAALGDAGVESQLERRFLVLVRRSGLPPPVPQVVHRDDERRVVARVDFLFPPDLVVELAGHRAHSSREHQQRDEERRTDLTVAGRRVITFTWNDVDGRPGWVVDRLTKALRPAAAA